MSERQNMGAPASTGSDEEMIELLPCPFCGECPVLLETNELRPDKYQRWVNVRCDMCGIEVGAEYQHEVIAGWNARASPVDPQAADMQKAIKLAMQALSAFGDTEEGVTTAYNILKGAVQ